MPPLPIISPDKIDCSRVLYTREQIYRNLPQSYEFAMLDGVVLLDTANGVAAAFRDVRPDEWWCRGHIPGRPLFPGVLMVESAAQLAAFHRAILMPDEPFLGFGGIDKAKFRDTVVPPCRLVLVGRAVEVRKRRFVSEVQGYVGDAMVFEGLITGMPINERSPASKT